MLSPIDRLLPGLEALYKDLHAHPELSMHSHGPGRCGATVKVWARGDGVRWKDRRGGPSRKWHGVHGQAPGRHGCVAHRGGRAERRRTGRRAFSRPWRRKRRCSQGQIHPRWAGFTDGTQPRAASEPSLHGSPVRFRWKNRRVRRHDAPASRGASSGGDSHPRGCARRGATSIEA